MGNKKLKIRIIEVLASVAIIFSAISLSIWQTAKADSVSPVLEMVGGASVRLISEDENEFGIRYMAKLSKDSYDENAEYYVMIIPTGWLDRYKLSKSYDAACDYYDVLVNKNGKNPSFEAPESRNINIMRVVPKLDGEDYYFSGSITDVKYENSFREFFGIAYMQSGETRTYASFVEGENVRSVSQVSSAALNDKEKWNENQKNILKGMVQKAYNASKDKDYLTVENDSLPEIKVDEVKAVVSEIGVTYQLLMPAGIPSSLGIQVKWSASSDCVSVDDNGLLTGIKAGKAEIVATVLGDDYSVATATVKDNVLVGFNDENSVNNIIAGAESRTYTVNGEEVQLADYTKWHETFEGRSGVIETLTASQGKNDWSTPLNLTFDKTYDEIMALDFDYISMWIWLDNDKAYGIRSQSVKICEDGVLKSQTWQEIKITKEQIVDTNSYWYVGMGTSTSTAMENFARSCASNRNSLKGTKGTNLIQIRPGKSNCDSIKVYIDSVSFGKNDDFAISVAEYTVPTVANEEFTIPKAEMKDASGILIKDVYTVSVTCDGESVSVVDNKFVVSKESEYIITYKFTYNGIVYEKKISFTI